MGTRVVNGIDLVGTTAQRPSNPDQGVHRLNSDTNNMEMWDGNAWVPPAGICAQTVAFAENGAGTYTGSINLPAGAVILDIIVNGVALWTAGTSATMKVGDAADDDGYFTGVNLKATDLLAGESISFDQAGGKAGAYIANSQVSPRYSSSARVISGIITSVGAGTAGRTRMTVIYCLSTVVANVTQ